MKMKGTARGTSPEHPEGSKPPEAAQGPGAVLPQPRDPVLPVPQHQPVGVQLDMVLSVAEAAANCISE